MEFQATFRPFLQLAVWVNVIFIYSKHCFIFHIGNGALSKNYLVDCLDVYETPNNCASYRGKL